MNRQERRAAEPILDRFKEDIDSGRFRLRYDAGADILTLVIYRPENPITFQDPSHGAFVDFDVDAKRISAMTILRFRKSFLPGHADEGMFHPGWRPRLAFRTAAILDVAAAKVGLDGDRVWKPILAGNYVTKLIRDYRDELRNDPDALVGFGNTLATPA